MDDLFGQINFYENLLRETNISNVDLLEQNISFERMCRACLREVADTNNLFQRNLKICVNRTEKYLPLVDVFKEVSDMEIDELDALPHQICDKCIENASAAYSLRIQCQKAETLLVRLIESMANTEKIDKHMFEESISKQNDDEDENPVESASEFSICTYEEVQCKSEEIVNEIMENNETILNENEIKFEVDGFEINFLEETSSKFLPYENYQSYEGERLIGENSHKYRYTCKYCHKRFDRKKKMTDHLHRYHPESNILQCEICYVQCGTSSSLNRHKLIHQADRKNKVCIYCGKRFLRASDLKRHHRVHTGERPYACMECPKRYKQSSELKEHIRSHSTERIYLCTICGKSFQSRNGRYVHMRSHKNGLTGS